MRLRRGRRLDLSATIEVPTLVIWGEEDIALDLICLEGTERYVRNLRIERHAPGKVDALLEDFLTT